jgi:tRNA pseudouridine32 synthase/23S rRNA pseudouridine746 synthase
VIPGQWQHLLHFLTLRFPDVGIDVWRQRLREGLVTNEAGEALHAESTAQIGELIFYYREVPEEAVLHTGKIDIIYQDEHLLVVDKPHLVPVMPAGRFLRESLLIRLRQQTGITDLAPLHRLDRDTAGLVMCATHVGSRDAYAALFRQRSIDKVYEVVAPHLDLEWPYIHSSLLVAGEPFFRVREVPGQPNSETRITLLKRFGQHSLYQAEPITGRKHQLRVHFASLGMPILFDRCYPELHDQPDNPDQPLQLLARSLRFIDPFSGHEQCLQSRLNLSLAT